MTDQEIVNSLNTVVDRDQSVENISGSELVNAVVPADYTALSVDDKTMFWNIAHLGSIGINSEFPDELKAQFARLSADGYGRQTLSRFSDLFSQFQRGARID